MEDLVNRSTANAETKDLLKLDAERDSYVSYLLATVEILPAVRSVSTRFMKLVYSVLFSCDSVIPSAF